MPTKKHSKNHNNVVIYKISQSEKIVNDFLLQAGYSLLASIVLLFIYNARMFKYGDEFGLAMPKLIWTFFGIFLVAAIVCFYFWKTKHKKALKTLAIYSFITSLGFYWCIGLEKIFFDFFGQNRLDADGLMKLLFVIIGVSIPTELLVYYIRMRKLKK